jgi:TonB family protein
MVKLVTFVILLSVFAVHGQDIRWRDYPTPRSGVVLADVDGSGRVIRTKMLKSTGDSGLDALALNKFREWRFKRGTAKQVKIPITFTPTGAKY